MYQLALSRFAASLSIYVASGANTDDAMAQAMEGIDHDGLRQKVAASYAAMVDGENPRSLSQAIAEFDVFEPLYARMLSIGMRAGSLEAVLDQLSDTFFEDAVQKLDHVVDAIEPALAAFLTVAVGATLIAVMLPLIGVMGSIG